MPKSSGRSEHHRKLNVLISAEIREHKLAGLNLQLDTLNLSFEYVEYDIANVGAGLSGNNQASAKRFQ